MLTILFYSFQSVIFPFPSPFCLCLFECFVGVCDVGNGMKALGQASQKQFPGGASTAFLLMSIQWYKIAGFIFQITNFQFYSMCYTNFYFLPPTSCFPYCFEHGFRSMLNKNSTVLKFSVLVCVVFCCMEKKSLKVAKICLKLSLCPWLTL